MLLYEKNIIPVPRCIISNFFSAKRITPDDKAEINFFKGTWSEALTKAKKENKPIFLDIYATWCGPCKLLKKQTFADKEVVKFFNTNFINVSLDGEKGDGEVLAQKYQIPGYPTLIILDNNENFLYTTAGFMPPKDFLEFGKEGLKQLGK
ncbi:MAG: thioredoxin family protein [Sphingobacteriales bacterium]|nr:thioredoxin family protein [Sphingobacteriales bacterium]